MPNTSAVASSPDPPTYRRGPAPEVFQLTCGLDGRAHLATVSSVEVAIADGRGVFTALCGHRIHAAALATPPGPACADCHRHPHRYPRGPRR